MAEIRFTGNLKRHVDCPSEQVSGVTLAECLDNYFRRHQGVRGYVLDDQGAVPGTDTLFAALDHGHFGVKLRRSMDSGKTWQELESPAYLPKPDDCEDRDPVRNQPLEWSLKTIWCLESGGREGELWAGRLPGGLFHSGDNGESWQLNEPLWFSESRSKWFGGGADYPGIHSVVVHPDDPDNVTLAVSCGGVWKTADGGSS